MAYLPKNYGPKFGPVLPDADKLAQCPEHVAKTIRHMTPIKNKLACFERGRPWGEQHWFDHYQTNNLNNLWVRRTDGAFKFEAVFPTGMRGGFLLGIYNSTSSSTSVSEMGDNGRAVSLQSTDHSEIAAVHEADDPAGFEASATLLDDLVKEKYDRRREFAGHYIRTLSLAHQSI